MRVEESTGISQGCGIVHRSQNAIRAYAFRPVVDAIGAEETSFTQWYDVDHSITNLENAYWNVMARPIEEEYSRKLAYVSRRNVPFVRGVIAERVSAC